MQALKILEPNRAQVVDIAVPEPGEHALLVRVMASGICGTDVHIFRGEYLGGYPVIPGHEFAGVIEKVGSGVTRFNSGDRVAVEPNIACNNCANCLNNRQNFCLNWQAIGVTLPGGMARYVVVPENAAFDIGALPFEQAAFMEPLSCVLHGIERLNPRMADRVAMLGAGPIGCLLLQALLLHGVSQVTMVDKNPSRLEVGRALGANECLDDLARLERDHYDAVVDATGAIPVMSRTLDYVRPGGKVLLFGVPPQGVQVSFDAFTIFHKGLTILSSYTSVRNSLQAVELLSSERIRVAPLISHRLPLGDFARGIELIEQGRENVLKVMILPNG